MSIHKPVLLKEVIEYLDPKPNQNFIDCTFGGGGHATAIVAIIGPNGKLLGVDANSESLAEFKTQNSKLKIKDRLILVNDNFRNLKSIYADNFPYPVSGVLWDLGLSSMELAAKERGFSFAHNGPLDMRFDSRKQALTAGEILNKYTLENLVKIFCAYGEVPLGKARLVARAIIAARKRAALQSINDLVAIILQALYPGAFSRGEITVATRDFYHKRKKIIHPATQFFQALRMEVNDELPALEESLRAGMEIIGTGGKLAVIAFHSLEDRIVKNIFRNAARDGGWRLLTKKPRVPTEIERADNPRSRSAKLRVMEKIR